MSEQITKFPSRAGTVIGRPEDLYANLVYPQIRDARFPLIYTSGPITSGWAFNYSKDMPEVIGQNSDFAVDFVTKQLLDRQRPIPISITGGPISIADTQITVPHALGKCLYTEIRPDNNHKRWGEFDYYIVWMLHQYGLQPDLAPQFAEAMGKNVDVDVVNDRLGPRDLRIKEVQTVYENTVRFMATHKNKTRPVVGVAALPEPALDHHEISVGATLEAYIAKSMNVPLQQLTLHLEPLRKVMDDYGELWKGPVAQWMLEELAKSPQSASTVAVTAEPFRQLDPW